MHTMLTSNDAREYDIKKGEKIMDYERMVRRWEQNVNQHLDPYAI